MSWGSHPLAWGSVWGADLGLCELTGASLPLAKPLRRISVSGQEARD